MGGADPDKAGGRFLPFGSATVVLVGLGVGRTSRGGRSVNAALRAWR